MTSALELFWIPLGAGARVVRYSGRTYEALTAFAQRRERHDLFHAALVATTRRGRYVIEMTPVPDGLDPRDRGVVGGGAVGTRWAGRLRVFRYEIRCWLGGEIPDLSFAVDSPVVVTEDADAVERTLVLVPEVPTPVWGRDELGGGEMWNSNSVVAWILGRADLLGAAGHPPRGGRAPGWDAGALVAARRPGGRADRP